jgi:hypothetical protein
MFFDYRNVICFFDYRNVICFFDYRNVICFADEGISRKRTFIFFRHPFAEDMIIPFPFTGSVDKVIKRLPEHMFSSQLVVVLTQVCDNGEKWFRAFTANIGYDVECKRFVLDERTLISKVLATNRLLARENYDEARFFSFYFKIQIPSTVARLGTAANLRPEDLDGRGILSAYPPAVRDANDLQKIATANDFDGLQFRYLCEV